MNTSFKIAVTALTSFAGGLIVGMLLTPQSGEENRKWISDNTDEAKNWLNEKGRALKTESEKRIHGVKETVKNTVPNLYEATEDLKLNDKDVGDG